MSLSQWNTSVSSEPGTSHRRLWSARADIWPRIEPPEFQNKEPWESYKQAFCPEGGGSRYVSFRIKLNNKTISQQPLMYLDQPPFRTSLPPPPGFLHLGGGLPAPHSPLLVFFSWVPLFINLPHWR